MIEQQHDHHCILTSSGVNWRIIGCIRGGCRITVKTQRVFLDWDRQPYTLITELDLSSADMDAYCAAAAAWDMRAEAVARDRAEGARDVRH